MSRILKGEYERVMKENDLDVFILPTVKYCAPKLPKDPNNMKVKEYCEHAYGMVEPSLLSNVTGFPSLQIPVKNHPKNGLPIGMCIVANNFEDAKCVHVANVYEKLRGPLKKL